MSGQIRHKTCQELSSRSPSESVVRHLSIHMTSFFHMGAREALTKAVHLRQKIKKYVTDCFYLFGNHNRPLLICSLSCSWIFPSSWQQGGGSTLKDAWRPLEAILWQVLRCMLEAVDTLWYPHGVGPPAQPLLAIEWLCLAQWEMKGPVWIWRRWGRARSHTCRRDGWNPQGEKRESHLTGFFSLPPHAWYPANCRMAQHPGRMRKLWSSWRSMTVYHLAIALDSTCQNCKHSEH